MKIRIKFPKGSIIARLDDTPTGRAVFGTLPCNASASTWGEEVYFNLPADVDLESDARQVVEPGTVCYWVQGQSLALPYGPTPVSQGSECRLVTKVNVLGRIEGDPRELARIREGDSLRVEAVVPGTEAS